MRCFNDTGLWASTARGFGRAYQAGTARISALRAVLGPKARHEIRRGTAREARRAVPARTPVGRAWPRPEPARWPSIGGAVSIPQYGIMLAGEFPASPLEKQYYLANVYT